MRTEIFGVSFDDISPQEALLRAVALATEDNFSYVVTPNPELVNLARREADYRAILNGATLVLADGIGVIHAAKILGCPIQNGRVPGIDLAQALLPELAANGIRLYLLGAKPGVAEEAAARLCAAHPGLSICGCADGYFSDPAAAAEAIKAAEAQVAFVCLGAPKQERFMREYGDTSGAALMLGLGGALDVFAGNVKRAPVLFQRLGLEWFYRLLREPSRIGRMIKLPGFLVSALLLRLRGGG